MTDARDELAEVVESFLMDASREFYSYRSVAGVVGLETGYGNEPVMIDCHALADAILAAGWRAPQPTHWKCGHEITVGNRGHDGDCIPCTIKRWEAGETTWNQ